MEIHVDGNRASAENTMKAYLASQVELPQLSDDQRSVAMQLGLSVEDYARSLLAINLEKRDLEPKVERAARLIERLASHRFPGLRVQSVWLNTFDEKFRFLVEWHGQKTDPVLVEEETIDRVLQSGSSSGEAEILRLLDYNVPENWAVKDGKA